MSGSQSMKTGRARLQLPGASLDETIPGLTGSADFFGLNYYFRYYVRMAATAVVLFFVITELPIDVIGLLAGLSLVVINIAVTAVLESQKKILPEEAS